MVSLKHPHPFEPLNEFETCRALNVNHLSYTVGEGKKIFR
jgi:hypothetical protein